MEVTQIKDIVNNALTETLGTAELLNEDLTNIIDVGTNLFNAQAYDKYAKSLVNQVGKMIIVNRIYTGRMPSVLMDSWEFGSVVEKIRTQLPKASVTEDWQLEDGKSYDPHVFYKPDVSVKFFNSKTTFEVDRSITDLQIKQSFQSADQMNGFLSSLQTAVANALTVATENLIMRTINNMVGETLANEYKGDDNHFDETKLSTKSGVRAINLLHEYNDKFTKTLAANKCIYDPDFIRYASFRIGDTADLLSGMSCLYNVGGTEKFTPASKLHTVMLSMFAKSAGVYLYDANGQLKDEYLRLPAAETVPFWQGSGTAPTFETRSEINIKTTSGETVDASGILCVMFDHEALGVTNYDRRTRTAYNPKGEFTNYFYKQDAGYFNDLDENFVVFFVA